jgi:N-acetyl-anhydromuramyl-L-alanine amidase AmpD
MRFDQDGWLDVADEIDILENTFDRQGHQPQFIILHGSAGGSSATDVANYMKNTVGGSNPVSSHFVIGQDGTIVQCVPISLASWGNGVISGTPTASLGFRTAGDGIHRDDWWNENLNPNLVTISIEHCKPSTDNSDQLTPAQQAASLALVGCICNTYGIPKRFADANGGITGHFSVDVVNRSRCPGPYPWQELWSYLQQEEPTMIDLSNGTVASHFSQGTGNVWNCTNGTVIGNAILDFYRSFGGDALCGLTHLGLPLSNEIGVGHPGVVYQRFERGVVAYDQQHILDCPPGAEKSAVYLMHIESGIGQDPRVTQLQNQITALQGQISQLQGQLDGNALQQKIDTLEKKITQAVGDLQQ